jgi:alkylhydroperoxidase/carboxymuconolactone decarboxylase family protein YurZ
VNDQLRELLPELVDGYERIRRWIDSDGALSAASKALLVASAAAARGAEPLAHSELARGRELGASSEQVAVCAGVLLLTRGEVACGRLLAAAGPLGELPPARAASELGASEYFLAYNRAGELPARLRLLRELAPEVFEGYYRMHHGILSSAPRTDAFAELVLCTVNIAELAGTFAAMHVASARRHGVSDAELVEAALCAIPVAGVAAWAVGSAAIFPDA